MDLNMHSIVKGIQELRNFVDNKYEPYMQAIMREVYAIRNNINSLYDISLYPNSNAFTEANIDTILSNKVFTDVNIFFKFKLNSAVNNTITLVDINSKSNKLPTNLTEIIIPAYITEPVSKTIFNVNVWGSNALSYGKIFNNNDIAIKFSVPFINIEKIEANCLENSGILNDNRNNYELTELYYIGENGISFNNTFIWTLPKLNYLQPYLINKNNINTLDLSGTSISEIPTNAFVGDANNATTLTTINRLLLPNTLVKIYSNGFNNLNITDELEMPFYVQIENDSCKFKLLNENTKLSLLVGPSININRYVLWLNDDKSGFIPNSQNNFDVVYSDSPYLNEQILSMYIPSTNIHMRNEK